tara:strand:+ start:4242 stop:5087 length:846 start_codon:yes stop_codon:yes gene_type:complete
MSIKDITIIIATFKSIEKIADCLNSISSEAKILLVENSNDSTFKERIEKDFKNIECILAGSNIGYGSSNNIGLKKTRTKYALILNPDTKLHSSALENFLLNAKKYPDFAIMGPYIQEEKDKKSENYLKNTKPIEVKNVKGFAMFLNLSQFKDVGFFDESFFFYFEEIDLCKRLTIKGKKIFLVPDIKISHEGGSSHNESINYEMELSRNWHWMWSTFNYHKKYKGYIFSLTIVFPKLISALIKVVIYLIVFNKKKREIYFQRLSGLVSAILGKKSWYRPNI